MSWVQYASLAISACACLLAAASFVRTGRWRDTDEAKALAASIADMERRISIIENEIEDLPTKADIRGLEERITAVAGLVRHTQEGINRIEGYFLQIGIGGAK